MNKMDKDIWTAVITVIIFSALLYVVGFWWLDDSSFAGFAAQVISTSVLVGMSCVFSISIIYYYVRKLFGK